LDRINRNTTEDIHRLQESTARKLDAYNDRLHDPFYQLVVTDAKLSENSDSYVLTATIPPHEQEQISINIRGNQLVLSGNRRSKEKIEDAPGRELSTSSFQTFSETFPLDMPVDSRALSRRFDGDQLTVTIPKRLNYKPAPMHEIKKAEPIRAERPKFPDNLTAADIGTKPERDEPLTLS
jgi:HSP20 family protein